MTYVENFIDSPGELYHQLRDQINWRQDHITLFGKTHAIPRFHAWYAEPNADYHYSGILLPRNDWSDLLLELKEKVEKKTSLHFNGVLLNYYRDGQDSNGWHADDEKELVRPIHVASISLGEERDMQFRLKGETKMHDKVLLGNGSLLVMKSPCQEKFQHQIPKRKRVNDGRINLTFRMVEKK